MLAFVRYSLANVSITNITTITDANTQFEFAARQKGEQDRGCGHAQQGAAQAAVCLVLSLTSAPAGLWPARDGTIERKEACGHPVPSIAAQPGEGEGDRASLRPYGVSFAATVRRVDGARMAR